MDLGTHPNLLRAAAPWMVGHPPLHPRLGAGLTLQGSRRGAGELTLLPSLTMCGPMAMTSLWKMLCSSTWLLTSGRSVPKPLLLNASWGAQELGLAMGEWGEAAEPQETPPGGGCGAGLGWAPGSAVYGCPRSMEVKSAVLEGSHRKTSLGGLTLLWLEECRERDKIKNKGCGVEPKAGGDWGR